MNTITKIRAHADPAAINKVTRFFNGTLVDLGHEMLQNARRAGATRMDVAYDPERQTLTFSDNGHGICDPSRVLAFGGSGWDETIARREDPAGMGTFALAGFDVTITSVPIDSDGIGPWTAHIPADRWTGASEVTVAALDEGTARAHGTAIIIALDCDQSRTLPELHGKAPGSEPYIGSLRAAVSRCAEYCPLEVTFDGQAVRSRKDILAGAVAIIERSDIRIGIFKNVDRFEPTVNFHGVTLRTGVASLNEAHFCKWHARVDIIDAPAIHLVLPARKEIVQNEAWQALQQDCLMEIYRHIASLPEHRLPYEKVCAVRAAGIEIADAAPVLQLWRARDEHSGNAEFARITSVPRPALLASADRIIENTFAISKFDALPDFFAPDARYRGYAWYDALETFEIRTVTAVTAVTNGSKTRVPLYDADEDLELHIEAKDQLVEEITLTLENRSRPDAPALIGRAPAFICLEDRWGSSFDEACLIISKADIGAFTLDAFTSYASAAAFEFADDAECDSWETQRQYFKMDAGYRYVRVIGGNEAVLIAQIKDKLDYVPFSIPDGKIALVEISAVNDMPTGERIRVRFIDRPRENAA